MTSRALSKIPRDSQDGLPFYKFQVGDFECVGVNDLYWKATIHQWFANPPKEKILEVLEEYGLTPDEENCLPGSHCPLLVNTGKNIVLIETGVGVGDLLTNIKLAGYDPEDIDTIVIAHAHYDHMGWNTDNEGKPTFPNARIVISEREWKYWSNQKYLEQLPPKYREGFRTDLLPFKKKMDLVNPEDAFLPGVRAVEAYGHTPGQIAVEITSNGQSCLYTADAAHHYIHFEYTDWIPSTAADPQKTTDWTVKNGKVVRPFLSQASREHLAERAYENGSMVFAPHFYPIKPGKIVKKGDRFAFEFINS